MIKFSCKGCKKKVPLYFLRKFYSNTGTNYIRLCPDCALEIRNEIHHLPKDTPFNGPEAKRLYDQFQFYKKNERLPRPCDYVAFNQNEVIAKLYKGGF